MLRTVRVGAIGWCCVLSLLAADGAAQNRGGQGRQKKEPQKIDHTLDGTIEGISQGMLLVKSSDKAWKVRAVGPTRQKGADGKPEEVPATTIDITGTANADFLQPGLLVHLRADIDGKAMAGREAVKELKIVTVSPEHQPGVIPDGGGVTTAPKKGKKPPVEGVCTITLPVKEYKAGKLQLSLGKKHLTVEVPDDAKIEVAATHPLFLQFVRKGDEIQAAGYYYKEGELTAKTITIKLTTPLTAPAGKTAAAKPTKPAKGKAPAADEPASEKDAADATKTDSTKANDEKTGNGKKPAANKKAAEKKGTEKKADEKKAAAESEEQ